MAFPVSPTNGQQSTIANIVYEYASATNSWTVIPGNANTIVATGNITASYFIGNGSQLTGITGGSGGGNSISSGTSNISIAEYSGNATVTIGGTSNVVVFSPGVLSVNGLVTTPKTIASNITLPANTNSQLLSPVTINSGVVITVPTSSTLYITP